MEDELSIEVIKNIEKKKYCQNCRFHKNKPSFCKLKNEFVGRKKICDQHKFKKM